MSDDGKEQLKLAAAGAISAWGMGALAFFFLSVLSNEATAWRLLSALMILGCAMFVVVRWWINYRQGRRAPLLLTLSVSLCMGCLAFNLVSPGSTFYISAMGAVLLLVGWGNYLLLMYEIQLGARK